MTKLAVRVIAEVLSGVGQQGADRKGTTRVSPDLPQHGAALTGVSATSRQLPSIATNRCPASHTPDIPAVPIGLATRANNASNGFDPNRARAWKIDLGRRRVTLRPARGPRQSVGQLTEQHVLIGTLGVQPHPDREVRHYPCRQRPVALLGAASGSDHLIDQIRRNHQGQHPPRPGRTTDDLRPASPIQNEACHQTTRL